MRREVDLGDRKVTVVGTAHVSEESRKEVREVIEQTQPDLVGVELDDKRFDSLRNESGWKDLDLLEAIRQGKGYMLLFNLLLSIYQRRIGLDEGMKPGREMLEAVETAEDNNVVYDLVDREIAETFQRLRDEMSLWEKTKLFSSFWVETDGEEYDIEDLKDTNLLDTIIGELEDDFPSVKKILLDERNSYMVEKLLENDFEHAVLVVGAAHVEGIVDRLENKKEPIHEEPVGGGIPWFKLFNYGLPAVIILLLGYAFLQHGVSTGLQATAFWIGANGLLSMLGAVAAKSHPLTWLAAFVSAPLTSLYPALGAGMVAAYVEGRFYPPKVGEMESIVYIEDYGKLWENQVGVIILTLVFVSIGSIVASLLGAGFIAGLIAFI